MNDPHLTAVVFPVQYLRVICCLATTSYSQSALQ